MTTAHESASASVRTGAEVVVSDLVWRPYGRTRPVLPGIDLRIEAGQKVLLAGPSGSGKSTLLRSIAGLLLTADSGDLSGAVTIGGQAPDGIAGEVGLVLQDPGAGVVASTIGRDVAFGLENLGMSPADIPARVSAALAEVGLRMSPDTSPMSLSGGQLQRLALAGALVMGPSVLLLDEPTAMLDVETAALVRDVVLEVVDRHDLTLVVVEHRLEGWIDNVDRLVVLDSVGSIAADGPARDVLAEHGESLAGQGIWVPGVPEPTPLDLSLPSVAGTAGRVADCEGVTAASDIRLERRSRSISGPVRATLALDGVSEQVAAGEALALVGPSGSGKSSLLSVIGGLIEPTSGSVDFAVEVRPNSDGHPTDDPPIDWRSKDLAAVISWVPQRAASTIVAKTVRDEVLATPRAIGLDVAAAEARADALLTALGLDHLATVDPRQLSGGEQRRLAVASAIAQSPALVLADEPTVGQDRLTWAAVIGVLRAARAEGSAVVAATHDQGVIDRAERVAHLVAPPVAPPEPERRKPLLARVGPLALLAVGLGVLPLPALLQNWRQGLLVLSVEIVLGLIGLIAPGKGAPPVGRLRGVALRLAPATLAVVGVGWSAWLLGGRDLEVAFSAALRVMCLVLPSAFVVGFIDPEELGDHLAQRLRLPARPVVAATAALQRLQSFDALWNEIMSARRARGIRADRGVVGRVTEAGAVTVGLLIGALGQAASLALAMDARGFAGATRRTWTGPAPWRVPDTLAVLAITLVVATAATARLLTL